MQRWPPSLQQTKASSSATSKGLIIMRTLFTADRSRKAVLRRLSAVTLIGMFVLGAPLQAFAEAGSGSGGPAGGAFMSSYAPRGNLARAPYSNGASTSWAYHHNVPVQYSHEVRHR